MKNAIRRRVLSLLAIAALGLSNAMPARAGYRLLHEFVGGVNDGAQPQTAVTLIGSMLYGTTYAGGSGRGTVFRINADGTSFELLHKFAGGANGGTQPSAALAFANSTLYGTTQGGGDTNRGTAFKMNSDGTAFQLLHEFAGGADDGSYPQASLTLDGSTLYGTTLSGGDTDDGTVFKISTDGMGHALLHEFDALNEPSAALTVAGSTLYGTTFFGGQFGGGTVFKINTDGTGFVLVHEFAVWSYPQASLTLDGSTLYGTTFGGGDAGLGTVFKINTDGTGFQDLHEFTGGANGQYPTAALTLAGSTLYGTTTGFGDGGDETIFKINTDGTGFAPLHQFSGGANDGAQPRGALTLVGSTLYGTTELGGDANLGTIFAIDIGIPGDYNGDGAVDAADYVVWRKNPGGIYTQNDLNIWRAHFGQPSGSGYVASANAAVPEPTTLVMLIVSVAGVSSRWRWHNRRVPKLKTR